MSIEFKQDTDIYNTTKTEFNPKDFDNNDSNFENLNVNKTAVLKTLVLKNPITYNNNKLLTYGINDIGYIQTTTNNTVYQITSNSLTQLFTFTPITFGIWNVFVQFAINTSSANTVGYRDFTVVLGSAPTNYLFRAFDRTGTSFSGSATVLLSCQYNFLYVAQTLEEILFKISIIYSGTGTININNVTLTPYVKAIRIA